MSNVEVRDPRFAQVVGADVEFERLGTGFKFTEGPIWHPARRDLLFSDMPGDHMRRWSAAGGTETVRQPCNKSNGMTFDRQGRVLVCEHATSRVVRMEPDGPDTVLATHHGDKELNSPNDIIVHSNNDIYFSDPTYGRMPVFGVERECELDFRGVYRVNPETRALTLLVDDFAQPNGLCFSRDEKQLFVNDTDRQHVRVFDVAADGTVGNSRVWCETTGDGDGAPDGMKIDSAGNLFTTGPGGIHVFDADATCLGVILTPERTANFCWGDDDMMSLFITASTSLYRVRVKVPGRPQLF
ncbi:MAG: SMP-30/gluconolactonase/LRE family protein [Alphaproteobacteria bacterium]